RSVRPVSADMTKGLKGRMASPYDRILVDAPCSGLGTLRSHPEAKWRRDENDIRRLSRLQKRIINGVASTLKSGGVLVYATCTITREENEDLVEEFLNEQKDFVLEEAQRYLPERARRMVLGNYFVSRPHLHDTDGFFAARLRKV
ncbi:MAG: RsmB/NOP family class I SAM-dependent RNA methyltransferase, partial [Gammaproteobacteria bacterium]|nr:RsmB/NOP family class I SAM-dependent RNA methyltransferase [Gammaproteobacteria bacterium]